MYNIENFLYDGANMQAQIIAIIIREQKARVLDLIWNKEWQDYEGRIAIGRFENCREQGYVVSLNDYKGNQRNYAFYEHRNSDNICVLVRDGVTINTPSLEYMWEGKKDKWDVDKTFSYGEWQKCADWILEDMKSNLEGWIEKRKQEKTEDAD
jgi:hypothetical protein